ncbi:MAG: hypothetical protein QOI10_1793 [Solirubrobacterales bacterium]|jgi:hypothetical protein|nr:hypothetical protein [Solirubrobacterales bacterium]
MEGLSIYCAGERRWLRRPMREELAGALSLSYRDADETIELTNTDGRLRWLENGQAVEARPGRDRWEAFWSEVDALDVWSWCRWYSPIQMSTDQPGWRLLMTHDDRLVSARGYGAFPPDGLDDPAALTGLVTAIRKLIEAN